jgi:hypothetical protein
MTPKKTTPKFEEEVIPEGAALPAEMDVVAPAPVRHGLTAYAPFDFNGRHYEAGEAFTLPAGYVPDPAFDTFRAMEKKNAVPGQLFGMAYTGKDGKRAILPVKEG